MFREVNVKSKPAEREEKFVDYWKEKDIQIKSEETRKGNPRFVFFEGPPTANGKPGIHHVLARTLKDSVCKYMTMKGFEVKRKAGWDTHGLPVEIEVEKQLGISGKDQIEGYGVAPFNKLCRESVFKYEKEWRTLTERIGYFLDLDNPYITLDNNYIESVWWILNSFFEKGLIYKGHKIVPYCCRCGTPLSSHEVSQGYKDVEDPSVYVKMKIKDQENTYFLVWTTTPWTLISNVALTVHEEVSYVKVEHEGEFLILAEKLLEKVLGTTPEIIERYTGKDLEYTEYEQMFPFVVPTEKAFFVTHAPYVTTEDGTGIVHTAPAFGEDDYQTGRRYNLPVLQPVDSKGCFTEEVTDWAGVFVKEADKGIIRNLKERNLLFRREQYKHSYPFCWRCDSPLLYYARKSWYIKTTDYSDKMIEANKTVEWFPKFVGEGRFGMWLENNIDWSLSRDRYWGTPLNIWVCNKCGKMESIGSIEALKSRVGRELTDVDLHRPWIDNISFDCRECDGTLYRTPEVIDCWFDSGAMPFAQHHYPFENKEIFDNELFPANFICEGLDQTRGWFYSLLAISTFVKGCAPYKQVLVNDLVLDKSGQKMSKSKGNVVDPWKMIDKYGADAVRWYLLSVSAPWVPTKFDEDGIGEVSSKFFGTLVNTCSFFITYANIDDFNPQNYDLPPHKREQLDRWILSRLQTLKKFVAENMAKYELSKITREISEFLCDDVSNWYVRRSRRRFWEMSLTDTKVSALLTLYEILVELSKVIAPFAPFISEEIYTSLTKGESVHLEDYPEVVVDLIDKKLEEDMKIIMDIVSLARAVRNKTNLKTRQPLSVLLVNSEYQSAVSQMEEIIKDEVNIKNIDYTSSLEKYSEFVVKPVLPKLGPKFGKQMGAVKKALETSDTAEIFNKVKKSQEIEIVIDGEKVIVQPDEVMVSVEGKAPYAVEMDHNQFAIIDTTLDESLIKEGFARELVNKIQFMRKQNSYEVMDRVIVSVNAPELVKNSVDDYSDYICSETLADKIIFSDSESEDFQKWSLNTETVWLKVSKKE